MFLAKKLIFLDFPKGFHVFWEVLRLSLITFEEFISRRVLTIK